MSNKQSNPQKSKRIVKLACQGGANLLVKKHNHSGQITCREANETEESSCPYGCLGLGDCIRQCKFSAMKINEQGLVEIDEDKCVGCGLCIKVCPRQLLKIFDRGNSIYIRCNAKGYGKDKRLYCLGACIGCNNCINQCSHGAINVVYGLAEIDKKLCTNCGNCINSCPSCLDYSKVIGV